MSCHFHHNGSQHASTLQVSYRRAANIVRNASRNACAFARLFPCAPEFRYGLPVPMEHPSSPTARPTFSAPVTPVLDFAGCYIECGKIVGVEEVRWPYAGKKPCWQLQLCLLSSSETLASRTDAMPCMTPSVGRAARARSRQPGLYQACKHPRVAAGSAPFSDASPARFFRTPGPRFFLCRPCAV